MKTITRHILILFALLMGCTAMKAQDTQVQNRPYTDLRPFHFGVMVGTHLQDLEFVGMGPQTITTDDGTVEKIITTDQDKWDAGFTVGVLGELRLGTHFAFRLAPAMYFGTRNIKFMNLTDKTGEGKNVMQNQELKTIYISSAMDLIFSAPRFNNHRPYLMAGISPMVNLSGSDEAIVRLKRYDTYAELGVGCDFYLPYFKLRPELKFMFSLINSLDTTHPDKLKDATLQPYARAVSQTQSKMIVLTFYFE